MEPPAPVLEQSLNVSENKSEENISANTISSSLSIVEEISPNRRMRKRKDLSSSKMEEKKKKDVYHIVENTPIS